MKKFIQKHKKPIVGLAACLLIGAVSMSFQNLYGPLEKLDTLTQLQDTIPDKKSETENSMTMNDYDQLMLKMDKGIMNMQEEISKLNLDKMHKDIIASLDNINFDKIQVDIDKAMKDVDFKKIENGVKTALKEVDWNKINADVKHSLQEAKKEIEKVNMNDIKKQMEDVKLELNKSKSEIEKLNFDEIMKNANSGIVKAKEELRLTKTMFNEMEKEGLINQKDGFSIEFKDKALFINGKKQSDATRDKYQKYIKGGSFKINIRKE
ncbi:MAG: hypothetical protein ABIN67_07305 [Ferruginibacter sp.]